MRPRRANVTAYPTRKNAPFRPPENGCYAGKGYTPGEALLAADIRERLFSRRRLEAQREGQHDEPSDRLNRASQERPELIDGQPDVGEDAA